MHDSALLPGAASARGLPFYSGRATWSTSQGPTVQLNKTDFNPIFTPVFLFSTGDWGCGHRPERKRTQLTGSLAQAKEAVVVLSVPWAGKSHAYRESGLRQEVPGVEARTGRGLGESHATLRVRGWDEGHHQFQKERDHPTLGLSNTVSKESSHLGRSRGSEFLGQVKSSFRFPEN